MIIHTSVESISEKFYEELRRRVYTTPKSYLDLIKLYLNTLTQKRKEDNENKDRLAMGVKKLAETNKSIAELKETLKELQPQLEEQDKELEKTLAIVKVEKENADEEERLVLTEKEVVEKQAAEAQEIKDDADADLKQAQPQMDAAKVAVSKLDPAAITEVKSFPKPPELVEFVMEAIMIYLGKKPTWEVAKKEMGNAGAFLK